jgi:hypothetical protein
VTHSILEVLATKPDWQPATPLSMAELGPYLSEHYGSDRERRERHRLRDELYRDGGCQYMKQVVSDQFEHQQVIEWRQKWVPHARFSNILKQIIGETSSVYSEPATRTVGGDEANEAQYAAHVEALMLDEVMDYANRMLNLHRAVLLGPRIRRDLDGAGTLVLDVVTPASVIAVTHPNDSTLVVAWLVGQDFKSGRTDYQREPKWQLWSDHEVGYLDEDFVPIAAFTEHKLGINPWVALTYHAEAVPGFWPGEDGADLVAAQVSIWMAGILMLKETKSATKQEIVTGDIGTAARGTPSDTDVAREYPEGVTATVVDRSMDPGQFTKPSDHVLERVAGAYGLAMGAIRHDMQSADAREAMMEPLRKIRRAQIKTFRRAERVLASVISRVLQVDAADVAFTVEAFAIDFGEPQVLMSPEARLELFLKMRSAGLFSTVEYLKLLNPDLEDDAAAWAMLDKFIQDETKRVAKMRELQSLSGSMGESGPGENPQAGKPQGPVEESGKPEMRVLKGGKADLSWVAEVANGA